MFNEKIPESRLLLWLATAVSAPVLCLSGRSSWMGVLLAAIICGGLSYAVLNLWNPEGKMPGWLCILQWIWLGIFLGNIAGQSSNCWEEGATYPVIPLVLLLLAGISAQAGRAKASSVGAVLIWFVAAILAVVFSAGVQNIHGEWIKPTAQLPDIYLFGVYLLPCVLIFLPRAGRRFSGWIVGIVGGLAVLSSLWVNGSMSSQIAGTVENPFYEYCKSISIFGAAERFESLASCTLTVGWFSLFSLMLSVAGHLTEQAKEGMGKIGVWACTGIGAAGVLSKIAMPGSVLAVGNLTLWVAVPLVMIVFEKISKKREKRT